MPGRGVVLSADPGSFWMPTGGSLKMPRGGHYQCRFTLVGFSARTGHQPSGVPRRSIGQYQTPEIEEGLELQVIVHEAER